MAESAASDRLIRADLAAWLARPVGEGELACNNVLTRPISSHRFAPCRWDANLPSCNVADPTRTILDMLDDPALVGGVRPTADVFRAYLGSDKKDCKLLVRYADQLGNGAVFKRLGCRVIARQEVVDLAREFGLELLTAA